MPARIPIRAPVAALACAFALAACTSSGGSGGLTPQPSATASPSGASGSTATTGPAGTPLDLRITSATAAATGSHVPRGQLRTAVHGVHQTLTSLYTIGFLDPAAPKKLMARLHRLANRAELNVEEVHILRGIARAISERCR